MLEFTLEAKYFSEGYSIICGTDEAGRGPLAGPVFAAACILPDGLVIEGLNDSKKISEKKREKLFDIICKEAISYGIASASVEEIDSLNILEAAQLAMRRAVAMLTPVPDLVLVDGNIARGFDMKAIPIIGGDALSPSIAAASILAKVSRDRDCLILDEKYPEYGFAKHKGYPTKEHRQKVFELGPCPDHRKSFMGFLQKMK
ncbi:MAG: ribonuclease HII [Clostridia bacterium]|nr:ribonuclease HII [Clostridia bacterium]